MAELELPVRCSGFLSLRLMVAAVHKAEDDMPEQKKVSLNHGAGCRLSSIRSELIPMPFAAEGRTRPDTPLSRLGRPGTAVMAATGRMGGVPGVP